MESIFKNIKALVFDCDGVMTNGTAMMTEQGEALRSFNIKDGYALQHAVKQGIVVAIISGGSGEGMRHRFTNLGVKDIYLGLAHKMDTFNDLCKKYDLMPEQVLYMGDDMPDIPILQLCGLPCCPKDAASEVLEVCQFISTKNGGEGAVREVIEQVMKTQNVWVNNDSHHF